MREEYEDQTISVRLVVAKTRIAPFQSISILRLELLGAKVGTRLVQGVMRVLMVPMSQVFSGVIAQMCCGGLRVAVEHINYLLPSELGRFSQPAVLTNGDMYQQI